MKCKDSMRDMWQNHEVGLWKRQVDACHLLKEVNTPLTSRVLRIHETRAWSLTSKFMKGKEEKSARVRPSWWSCTEGTDKRRSMPVSTFWVSRDLEARVGSFNSQTREW
jgi:hypothetical protein